MASQASTTKTSVSIHNDLWDKLKDKSNKSSIINLALSFYFEREDFVKQADEAYWDQVRKSIASGDGEFVLVNPGSKEITDAMLEKTLWN